ncbi:ABC transporter ATP-binding protein [Galactobacter valiniphilus]|uniref:ABC transporter ATP-binding protein n=1 Tax=Galactobacter valiniphilus TaxID=2676122 RepID=UPI003735BCA1
MTHATPEQSTPEAAPLLEVKDLSISFRTQHGTVEAVQGASLTLRQGQTLAIVGESGSGKSTTAMAIIGLLPDNGSITSGSISFDGKDLAKYSDKQYQSVRGNQIGLVPQDPMSNLNPVTRVGEQIAETLLVNKMATKADVNAKVLEVMGRAGIPNPEAKVRAYPHELSGGLRQRVLIAIGLACRPRLLIADEPTSALDVTVQRTILDQIDTMTTELGTSVLLITHDLGLAAERAEQVVVMHRGRVVEQGDARQILENPQHEYTKKLVAAAPSVGVARQAPGAYTAPLAEREELAAEEAPAAAPANLVELRDLTKVYPIRGKDDFYAAKGVSLDIPRGSTVAIVGESGSGKTTTARMLLGLIQPTSGTMTFDGKDLTKLSKADAKDFRRRVQPVFQDPYSSLNPMFTIGRIIQEPMDAYKVGDSATRRARVRELLDQVALPQAMLRRYPSELSGGQRQRVAIARALALEPELIVCDEPVSALDVLVQAQILKLLADLQAERGLSYLFISHDLAVVRLISDYVCVMQNGELVEAASSEEIFTNPRHPYTRKLLASIPGNELGIQEDPEAA